MNDTDLNTNEIESFFNFGKASQEKPVHKEPIAPPAPQRTMTTPVEPKKNTPVVTRTTARENSREQISEAHHEVERSGMTFAGEVTHHPTRKSYPERTFDTYAKKDARLEESDIEMLKAWANKIAHVKRKLGQNTGTSNRITDNTILRLILTEFCDKLVTTFNEPSYKEVLTEDDLRAVILKTMEKKSIV